MKFSVLASGSKANCTYLESEDTAILIDCGLSTKQTTLRMEKLGLDPMRIAGILVSHEHSDHIRGISVLSRKYKIPVYANRLTGSSLDNVYSLVEFETGSKFDIGSLTIEPFAVVHDAVDPVGFAVDSGGFRFVQATDIGKITSLIRHSFRGSNAIVIEANYDEEMLRDCQYPWLLKQRIGSSHGHLSNKKSAEFISEIDHKGLQHVVLGHLSENSNSPERALTAMEERLELDSFETFLCGGGAEATPLIELICNTDSRMAV